MIRSVAAMMAAAGEASTEKRIHQLGAPRVGCDLGELAAVRLLRTSGIGEPPHLAARVPRPPEEATFAEDEVDGALRAGNVDAARETARVEEAEVAQCRRARIEDGAHARMNAVRTDEQIRFDLAPVLEARDDTFFRALGGNEPLSVFDTDAARFCFSAQPAVQVGAPNRLRRSALTFARRHLGEHATAAEGDRETRRVEPGRKRGIRVAAWRARALRSARW